MSVVSLFEVGEEVVQAPAMLGISCHTRMLKLAYQLAQFPDFYVQAIDDFTNTATDSVHQAFEITYIEDQSTYTLLANKGSNGRLLSKYKGAEYILCSDDTYFSNENIIEILSELRTINLCFVISKVSKQETHTLATLL